MQPFTKDELAHIILGVDSLIASAKRAQKGAQPALNEVHAMLERKYTELKNKALNAIDQIRHDETNKGKR